ncbi:Cullin-associated NEDD8-dissociated protein 1 [Borealophlyctis nickersoniae]|nr:Cullin-associated NEDD8-dissociated protein 1 [Borealophlyctis nickersoniae]
MSNQDGPYLMAGLLEKMKSNDADFRYMATADLMTNLEKGNITLDESNAHKVVVAVTKLLEDKNGEVQNLAVKCLAPIVKRIHEPYLQEIVDQLCKLLLDKSEALRDIASIGLKTVIVEIPSQSPVAGKIVFRLIPKLVEQLKNTQQIQMDTIDILSEVLSRFGSQLVPTETTSGPALQKAIQDTLLPLLDHQRFAVRKRTTVAIGSLVQHTSDALFDALMARVVRELKEKEKVRDYDKLRTLIGCVAVLSRSSAERLGTHLDQVLPLVLKYAGFEDDELRENCLNALESFVLRLPTEITPHISTIVSLALGYIKYDPNYDAGDEDESMEVDDEEEGMDEDDEPDEEEDDEDDYSDDDDVSWKVRRASSKLLASVIDTRPELLVDLLNTVAPALTARFQEREESVRVDVLGTFIALVRQTGSVAGPQKTARGGKEPMNKKRKGANGVVGGDGGPKGILRQQVPRICKALSKQLNSKSVQTRQTGFTLLRELVNVLDGGLENHIGLFVPAIENSLSNTNLAHPNKANTNTNLKIEVLDVIRVLFVTHEPEIFHKHLARLVPPVVASAKDKFYKITSEALNVFVELIKVIRPFQYNEDAQRYEPLPLASPEFGGYLQQIYETTLARLKTSDADLEVKERSIAALGTLLSQVGDLLPREQVQTVVFPLLADRLKNELTRLTTVRILKTIAESPLAETNGIDLTAVVKDLVEEIASYLRKSQRPLRVAVLQTLDTLLTRYGRHVDAAVYPQMLTDLKPLLADSDLHILPLAMNVLCVIVFMGQSTEVMGTIRKEILPQIVDLVIDAPHLVGAGSGLESLLRVWEYMVRFGGAQIYSECVDLLLKHINSQSTKQANSIVAKSIATLCVTSEQNRQATVANFIERAQNASPESMKYLSLLTLGEIGRKVDLSKQNPHLDGILFELFSSPSEEIKQAAAFALGNVALGNLDHYMKSIFDVVKTGGQKRYLTLVAIREIIVSSRDPASFAALQPFTHQFWEMFFEIAEGNQEEATRNVIAECLGKLSLSNPYQYVADLKQRAKSDSPVARGTAVTAVRYTFTEHTDVEEYDGVLAPMIMDFLRAVKDKDLNVRKVALATLNSAAHNKPQLIRESLHEILPLLYEETEVNHSLIRMVEMGPFKHQVDDGLEARKTAYECMYTMLESCLSRIQISEFLDRVVQGLNDPAAEIKTLNHLMLQRLCQLTPSAVAKKLNAAATPLKATLMAKPKQNAVKQEMEKNNDLVRSAARTVYVLMKVAAEVNGAAGAATSVAHPNFDQLVKEATGPQSSVGDIMTEVQKEVDAGGSVAPVAPTNGPVPMDVS